MYISYASVLLYFLAVSTLSFHSPMALYHYTCCQYSIDHIIFAGLSSVCLILFFLMFLVNSKILRYLFLLLACHGIVDLGVICDTSDSTGSTADQRFADLKELISDIVLMFDISKHNTHFAYIPFSTYAGDYSPNQWFNNSVVANIEAVERIAQKAYINGVVQREPKDPTRGVRGIVFFTFWSHFNSSLVFYYPFVVIWWRGLSCDLRNITYSTL